MSSIMVQTQSSPDTAGQSTGNFKINEDMNMISTYVFVTTNAVVGTNQDGDINWEKIC